MAKEKVNDKNARFDTRLPKEQKIYFERAARLGGYRNLTDFVVRAAQEKANEIIAEKEQILASEQDSKVFFDAVMYPTEPNKALSQAAEDFKALFTK